MFLLSLVGIAQATVCYAPEIVGIAPANGATDVPLDSAIAVELQGSCGSFGTEMAVLLEEIGEDGAWSVVLDTVVDVRDQVVWIEVTGGLARDTEYRFEATPAGAPAAAVTFETGSGTGEVLTGEPVVSGVEASYSNGWFRVGTVRLGATVEPVQNPSGASVVGLIDADTDLVMAAGVTSGEERALSAAWYREEQRPDEACVRVVQWDAAGRPIGAGETVCAVPEKRGCATVPGAGHAWLACLGMLASRRRMGTA